MLKMTVLVCSLALLSGAASDKSPKPSVSLKSTPTVGFSPAKFVFTAELKGGENDYQEFYCPTVEWDFGDDTHKELTEDCDPWESGKTEIKRRYVLSWTYKVAGEYKIEFRLKQKNKVVGSGSTTVNVRPGVRDGGGDQ